MFIFGLFFVTCLRSGAFFISEEPDGRVSNSNYALDISKARSLNDHNKKQHILHRTQQDAQGLCSVGEGAQSCDACQNVRFEKGRRGCLTLMKRQFL